jgi:C4-dicarboxylate-specific signal transduction histidine kinase
MAIRGIGSYEYRGSTDMGPSVTFDEESQTELTHANRLAAIGQMSASIVHEVSQPISATLYNAWAALEVLKEPSPDIEDVRQAVDRIWRDCNRAVSVLSSMRSMMKKTPPSRDDCQLNEVVKEVVGLAYGEATANLISIETNLADSLPVVQADRVQLQQVVLNLIMNAIEAMSDTRDGARRLTIRTMSDATHAVVSVQDSGPGLNPATIDRIFEAYYTTKTHGLGVGLSICKSIIESHRGKLWAAQNEGRGATFSFSIPLGGPRSSRALPLPTTTGARRAPAPRVAVMAAAMAE